MFVVGIEQNEKGCDRPFSFIANYCIFGFRKQQIKYQVRLLKQKDMHFGGIYDTLTSTPRSR